MYKCKSCVHRTRPCDKCCNGDMYRSKSNALLFVLVGISCLAIGWILGANDGFDTGYHFCQIELNAALTEQLKDEKSFWVRGIKHKFFPRKDKSGVNYAEVVR